MIVKKNRWYKIFIFTGRFVIICVCQPSCLKFFMVFYEICVKKSLQPLVSPPQKTLPSTAPNPTCEQLVLTPQLN